MAGARADSEAHTFLHVSCPRDPGPASGWGAADGLSPAGRLSAVSRRGGGRPGYLALSLWTSYPFPRGIKTKRFLSPHLGQDPARPLPAPHPTERGPLGSSVPWAAAPRHVGMPAPSRHPRHGVLCLRLDVGGSVPASVGLSRGPSHPLPTAAPTLRSLSGPP